MNNENFTNTFLAYIKPGNTILDLGAGEGRFTQMFIEHGAIVTAVDVRPPTLRDTTIIIKEMRIEHFCEMKKIKITILYLQETLFNFSINTGCLKHSFLG